MSNKFLRFTIFLASPSDVTAERQCVIRAIGELNTASAISEEARIEIVAWDQPGGEPALSAKLSPQEAINRKLRRPSECNLVIAIFWSRIGTPVKVEGKNYESGTHFELMDGLSSNETEVYIYRRQEKKYFEYHDKEGQEQNARLDKFFESPVFYNKRREALRSINEYETVDDFCQRVKRHIETEVRTKLKEWDPSGSNYADSQHQPTNTNRSSSSTSEVSGTPLPFGLTMDFVYAALFAVLVAIIQIVFSNLVPLSISQYTDEIAYVLIGIGTTLIVFLRKNRSLFERLALASVAIVVVFSLFIINSLSEHKTVYFLVDLSEEMTDYFDELRPRLQLNTQAVPSGVDIGLAVYGGALSTNINCNDFVQLIPPASREESISDLNETINTMAAIRPVGYGNLQDAVLFAVDQLAGRQGSQQIIAITSGIDRRCRSLDREEINVAETNAGIEVELVIITVGTVSNEEIATFESYSDRYLNVGTISELTDVLEEVVQSRAFPYGPYYQYEY